MSNNLYVGLVHFPVYNKFDEVVTTSITNLDIHDISRSCRTFGVRRFFVINPLETQKKLLERILEFWDSKIAKFYNPYRADALSLIEYADTIESAVESIKKQEEDSPIIITTTAAKLNTQISYKECYKIYNPILLLFGTGNGLTSKVHKLADYILKPIEGVGNYNHLSVRSAAAIVLDRLTSEK